MIKLKPRHKVIINKGIQRIYNLIKKDYPKLDRVTILLASHPSMEDGDGFPLFTANDLTLEGVQDNFVDPCTILVLAKSFSQDNKITPLTWYQLEECGFTLYASNENYKEMISL